MERAHAAPSGTARILRFERAGRSVRPVPSRRLAGARASDAERSPVESFGKYESGPEDTDDYRHRQLANLAAFVTCVFLVAAGVWIANTMADLQRDQNCVLSGGKNCAQVSIIGTASR